MTTRKIENPFHAVVLNYHDKRKESSYEKSLVNRYISFLNALQIKKEQLKELSNKSFFEQLMVDEMKEALPKMEALFNPIFDQVNNLKTNRAIGFSEFSVLKEKYQAASEQYQKFEKDMILPLNKLLEENRKATTELYDWFEEDVYTAYLFLNVYSSALYKVKMNYCLDVSRFYDEMDSMKPDWNALTKEWDKVYQLREDTVDLTDACVEKALALYEKIQELNNEIKGMQDGWSAMNN